MNTILHHVILDTDIGTDVDDLMALTVLLGTPSVDLVGITTVYGDTGLRARLAKRVLAVAGRDVPVHAGERATMSGRPVWWAGHEGALYPDLGTETYDSDDAVRFLVETVRRAPGEIDLIAIGPLTNIARAILADASFAAGVRGLWIMGGSFGDRDQEHNFRSDDAAARVVFGSGIPTVVTGLEITRQVQIGRTELARIADSGTLGALIRAEIQQWWDFWNEEWNVPHDPITVLTLTEQELFELGPLGGVSIGATEDEGVSEHQDGTGSVRVVTGLDAEAVTAEIVDRIVACSAAHAFDAG